MADSKAGATGLWARLWRQPRRWWLFGIPVGAVLFFVLGVIFWGGFNWSMELSNTEKFCTSCHEMRDFVYAEYQGTAHHSNASGVRASCPDCHVPKPWIHKVIRKIRATNELYHKLLGTISTPEKFEAQRARMALHVWEGMRATDSRECRNCHHMDFMDLEKQGRRAAKKHDPVKLAESGETCIDCHQGIAHELPSAEALEAAQAGR